MYNNTAYLVMILMLLSVSAKAATMQNTKFVRFSGLPKAYKLHYSYQRIANVYSLSDGKLLSSEIIHIEHTIVSWHRVTTSHGSNSPITTYRLRVKLSDIDVQSKPKKTKSHNLSKAHPRPAIESIEITKNGIDRKTLKRSVPAKKGTSRYNLIGHVSDDIFNIVLRPLPSSSRVALSKGSAWHSWLSKNKGNDLAYILSQVKKTHNGKHVTLDIVSLQGKHPVGRRKTNGTCTLSPQGRLIDWKVKEIHNIKGVRAVTQVVLSRLPSDNK